MKDFGLDNIESLRKQIKCREGLLIDYDYASVLAHSEGVNMETTMAEGESGGRDSGLIERSQDEEGGELGEKSKAFNPPHKLSGGQTVSLYFDM